MLAAQREYTYFEDTKANNKRLDNRVLVEHKSRIADRESKYIESENSTTSKVKSRFGIITNCFFIVALCITMLLGYATVTKLKYEIRAIEKETSLIQEENQRIGVVLDQIEESEWIKNYANQNLGMFYPDENQIVELELPNRNSNIKADYDKNKTLVGSKFTEYLMDSILKITKTN